MEDLDGRISTKLQYLAHVDKEKREGVQEFATVSHSIYLLETQFPVLLRTATQLLPLVARQR
ncbi:hypothetical protein [Pilibacter termitis]|uniref:hypothetical protein n=1 Tax=Pilibacter termitis TaxID=263852 RepID=UPI000999C103|nr:hypothetical protein [Pilibacter termitis]